MGKKKTNLESVVYATSMPIEEVYKKLVKVFEKENISELSKHLKKKFKGTEIDPGLKSMKRVGDDIKISLDDIDFKINLIFTENEEIQAAIESPMEITSWIQMVKKDEDTHLRFLLEAERPGLISRGMIKTMTGMSYDDIVDKVQETLIKSFPDVMDFVLSYGEKEEPAKEA